MEYLKTFVGHVITVDLSKEAREDKMMRLFYETDTHNDFIGNKLLGVDSIGIWLEAFKDMKRLVDDDGVPIPTEEQKAESVSVSLLIPYGYIKGIACINNMKIDRKIGFVD